MLGDIPAQGASPVSLTPAANLPLVPFATSLNNTSRTRGLAAGVVDTCGKFCHRCHLYQWCTLTCKYLREFSKNSEMTLMLLSGAWGKTIPGKKPKAKNLQKLDNL
jgi:hypothetical protein